MSCNYPKKAFQIGFTENGKKLLKIVPYGVDHLEFRNGKWNLMSDQFVSPYAEKVSRDGIEIPCGKCLGCKLQYSKNWADRMLLESTMHDENWFITLTYDDDHLPHVSGCNPDTGEFIPFIPTLVKRDFQLFMKRLRKNSGQDLRYFACGEYGTDSQRPHYHLIVFGLHLDPKGLHLYKMDRNHNPLYNHDLLSLCWKNGYSIAAHVSYDTCAYVARYVTKKLGYGKENFYDSLGIEKEFCLMSRRPGIGYPYFEQDPDVVRKPSISIATDDGGKTFKPPKYFQNKYEALDPEFIEELKAKNKEKAIAHHVALMEQTDLDYQSYLQVAENNLKDKTRILMKGEL